MAVGDIIADINAILAGTPVDFQPAAGVEIILTAFANNAAAAVFSAWDGTLRATIASGIPNAISTFGNIKYGITNTNFLRMDPTTGTVNHGYTGIQMA